MRNNTLQSQIPMRSTLDLQAAVKRGIDLLGAALLLLLLLPLFAMIAALVKIFSPGQILYRQTRIGKEGREFTLLKFRTMQVGADERLQDTLQESPDRRMEFGSLQKLRHDPRMTGLGKLLRRASLDELPQLWNVLRGEMSLVGPRPFLPEQQDLFGPDLWLYLQTRPGMTGLWQISGRNQLSFQDRVRCDSHYLRNWSIGLDLIILLRTPWVVIRGKGAY